MRKLMVFGSGSLLAAIGLVAVMAVAAPAPVAAEPGSRVCGWLVQKTLPGVPASDASVVMHLVIMGEVKEGEGGLCSSIQHGIWNDGIGPNASLVALGPGQGVKWENRVGAYNRWIYFEGQSCENLGGYLGGGDPCDRMNRSSGAKGDQHVYNWRYVFFAMDANGNLMGCNKQPASATNPPCRLPEPALSKTP